MKKAHRIGLAVPSRLAALALLSCALAVPVRADPATVVVEVHDEGAGQLALRPLSLEAETGRGLQIVSSLAARWGARLRQRAPGRAEPVTMFDAWWRD